MTFGRILLFVNIVVLAALGIWALVSPEVVLSQLGVTSTSVSGIIEMQVILAGSFFGIAMVIARGAFHESHVRSALLHLGMIYTGWLLVRLLALLQRWPDEAVTWVYLAFEVVMLVLIGLAHNRAKPRQERQLFKSSSDSLP